MPEAVKIESAIWSQLLTEQEQKTLYAEFNFNGLMRGDIKTRFEAYQIGINAAIITPNEARKWENLDTDPDVGNKQMIQMQYATLEKAEAGQDEQETTPQTTQEDDNNEETN